VKYKKPQKIFEKKYFLAPFRGLSGMLDSNPPGLLSSRRAKQKIFADRRKGD
jgi:hypothetical protein